MTAPLTPQNRMPQDQPPHHGPPGERPPAARYDPDGLPHTGVTDSRQGFGRELRRGALVALCVTVAGVPLGLLWLWLAPRIAMVSDGKAVYLKNTEGEQAVGADGTFILLGLALGALCAAVAFWRCRKGGIGVVLGLAAGALLGSVVGWRLGTWLGPTQDIVAQAKAVGKNVVFEGPLELRAKGALLAWPIGATLVHLALTSAFGPRDDFAP